MLLKFGAAVWVGGGCLGVPIILSWSGQLGGVVYAQKLNKGELGTLSFLP